MVNAQQMGNTLVLVAAGADRLATTVIGQGCPTARGEAKESRLILGRQAPMIEQGHDHGGERAAVMGCGNLMPGNASHCRLLMRVVRLA